MDDYIAKMNHKKLIYKTTTGAVQETVPVAAQDNSQAWNEWFDQKVEPHIEALRRLSASFITYY